MPYVDLRPRIAVMIDLETLALTPDAVIVSIGAAMIDLNDVVRDNIPTFYKVINRDQPNRYIRPDTVDWWMVQSDDTRAVFRDPTINLSAALKSGLPTDSSSLSEFFKGAKLLDSNFTVWSKGVDFDIAILEHAYHQLGITIPWHYRQRKCFRTLSYIFRDVDISDIVNPLAHNALEDAKYQARVLHRYLYKGD